MAKRIGGGKMPKNHQLNHKRWLRDECGQAVLETALISLVLLVLFAGAVDVGRMFYHYISVTNAAREGARTASRLPCNPASAASRSAVRNAIVASAVNEAGAGGTDILPANVTVTPDPVATGCAAAGAPIRVTVAFDYANLFTNLTGSAGVRLSNGTTMVAFGPDTGG
jgi:Flp pilus assembly protein TadG